MDDYLPSRGPELAIRFYHASVTFSDLQMIVDVYNQVHDTVRGLSFVEPVTVRACRAQYTFEIGFVTLEMFQLYFVSNIKRSAGTPPVMLKKRERAKVEPLTL